MLSRDEAKREAIATIDAFFDEFRQAGKPFRFLAVYTTKATYPRLSLVVQHGEDAPPGWST
jgi:hypothetical protein